MKKSSKRNGLVAASAVAVSMVLATTAVAATLGDADLDGMVSVSDAVILAKFLAGQGTVDSAAVIDFDGSGTVDVIDLTMLKRSIANITDPETPVTGDAIITAITYANGSVTLTNAAGETVDPASAANVTVTNNTYVTITQPGEYDVSGECANGQLNINCDKTTYAAGQVTCNLLGLNLANTADSPIYVTAIDDEFVLTVKPGLVRFEVKRCPAWEHVTKLGLEHAPGFCLQTEEINNGMCEGTPWKAHLECLGDGRCVQTFTLEK